MNDDELDRIIDKALDIPLPEGLSERLEAHIDALAAGEKKRQLRHRFAYWAISTAAVALLCIGVFVGTEKQVSQPQMADTFTNPQEAAIAAEKALVLMSAHLNKGIDQVENAGQKIEKVNQILDKHLKE